MSDYVRKFYTRIGELYSGPAPSRDILERLQNKEIYCIWNLAEELQDMIEVENKYAEQVLFANIPDFSIPKDKKVFFNQLEYICDLLKDDRKIFLHCMAGRGRTGMALACVKRQLEGATALEALTASREHCDGPESDVQVEFVTNLMYKIHI